MKKLTLLSIVVLSLQSAAASPAYKIEKDVPGGFLPKFDRTVEIELPERITEKELEVIAKEVYDPKFKNTLIGYRIKGEKKGGYWATTHYLPNMKVEIIAGTKEEIDQLKKILMPDVSGSLGTWLVPGGIPIQATIAKDVDGSHTFGIMFRHGESVFTESMISELSNGQLRYYTAMDKKNGKFYAIGKDGSLEVWDSKKGLIYTALPLNRLKPNAAVCVDCVNLLRTIPSEHWDFMEGYSYQYSEKCTVTWSTKPASLAVGPECRELSFSKLKSDALKSMDYVKKNSSAKNFFEYYESLEGRGVQHAPNYSIEQSRSDARKIWVEACIGAKSMQIKPATEFYERYKNIQLLHVAKLYSNGVQTAQGLGGMVNCAEQGAYAAQIYTSDIDIRTKQ